MMVQSEKDMQTVYEFVGMSELYFIDFLLLWQVTMPFFIRFLLELS